MQSVLCTYTIIFRRLFSSAGRTCHSSCEPVVVGLCSHTHTHTHTHTRTPARHLCISIKLPKRAKSCSVCFCCAVSCSHGQLYAAPDDDGNTEDGSSVQGRALSFLPERGKMPNFCNAIILILRLSEAGCLANGPTVAERLAA